MSWLGRRRTQENLIAAALLVVFGAVIWLSQDFGPRARMIPLPLAIFGVILTLIQIVWQNVRSTEELKMDLISVAERAASAEPQSQRNESRAAKSGGRGGSGWLELRAYGIVASLIGLILVVGAIPAVFVFTGAYFVVTRQYSWLTALVYTTAFTMCIYVLFFAALQIQPYYGLLEPLVERYR